MKGTIHDKTRVVADMEGDQVAFRAEAIAEETETAPAVPGA